MLVKRFLYPLSLGTQLKMPPSGSPSDFPGCRSPRHQSATLPHQFWFSSVLFESRQLLLFISFCPFPSPFCQVKNTRRNNSYFQIKSSTKHLRLQNWGTCNRFQIHTRIYSLFFLQKINTYANQSYEWLRFSSETINNYTSYWQKYILKTSFMSPKSHKAD